jgi:hypothetical protein
MTANQSSVFVEGRGDMGRTPFFTQTDVLVSHDLKMTRSKTLRFELNVSNLFNQKTVRHIFNYYNRGASAPVASSAVSLSKIDLANGYDYVALVAATADAATLSGAKDPRYGKPDLWNTGVQAHVSVRFLF